MNINLMRLRSLTRAVQRSASAQERIALALETYLRDVCGLRLTVLPEEEKGEPAVEYADDLTTAAREAHEELVKLGYRAPDEEK